MARRHRFHKTNATYHIMLRGNNGQSIFTCENDKAKICLLIQKGIERFGHSIEAFCFMSNHIHLAVRVTRTNISRIMQHLAFCYTRYFNRQYKRIGHLFQGRLTGFPCKGNRLHSPQKFSWNSRKRFKYPCKTRESFQIQNHQRFVCCGKCVNYASMGNKPQLETPKCQAWP